MKLTPIESWTNSTDLYRGKYRNEQGQGLSGWYRRDYKKNSEMLVINNGNVLCRYKYPKIACSLDTLMLSWQNLYFCGGYYVQAEDGTRLGNDDLLIDAVISGHKPIGFIIVKKTEIDKYIKKAAENNLKYSINPHFWEGHCEIGLANRGRIEDYFNIDNLIEVYDLYSKALGYELISQKDKEWLNKIFKVRLSDFICGFEYAKSNKSDCEHILTGLLLGYPIESTVALIDYKIN